MGFQRPRGRVNCQTRARAPRAHHARGKFTEIYRNPRARSTRALCIDFASAKNTVLRRSRHLARIKIHPPGHPTCGSVSRSDPIFKFLEFHCEIFEISREYTGATRPLPLSTHTNAAGTEVPPVDLWSVDFAVLWSVDFRSVLGRIHGILVRCSLTYWYNRLLRPPGQHCVLVVFRTNPAG